MGLTKKNTAILISTLLVTFAITVPIAFLLLPVIHRDLQLNKLHSPYPADRHDALVYIQKHIDSDPAIVKLILPALRQPDDQLFLQLYAIIDAAGKWKPDIIPPPIYIRQIGYLVKDHDPDARILASQKLAAAYPHISLDIAMPMLTRLTNSSDPIVRYNALVAGAQFNNPKNTHKLISLISPHTIDPDPTIARHSYLLLSMLQTTPAPSSSSIPDLLNLQTFDPAVQQAYIYYKINSLDSPNAAKFALKTAKIPRLTPSTRAMAAYALQNYPLTKNDLRTQSLDTTLDDINLENQLLIWRSILSIPALNLDSQRTKLNTFATVTTTDSLITPLIHAATHRLAFPYILPTDNSRLKELAAWEGFDPASADIVIPALVPDMLRLAAVRAMKNPAVKDIMPLFDSPHTTIHNQASILTVTRLNPTQQAQLIANLLINYNDNARQSAAIILGLAHQSTINQNLDLPMLLQQKIDDEDIWHVKRTLELGLWMRHRKPYPPNYATNLLARPDIPQTSTLLALLARQPQTALDHLLRPTEDLQPINITQAQSLDILELLVKHRWWYVLKHFLPEDAPQINLWADPDLQQFQLDLLRDWYLLNRHRFRQTQK